MNKTKILELINKLSVLSNDVGAFQGEISNASAKIQELMEEYSISQLEVMEYLHDTQNKEMSDVFDSNSCGVVHLHIKRWHWQLASIIAKITMTKHYATGKRMAFFGTKENVAVAIGLYELWFENIEKTADKATKEHRREILRKYGDRKNFFRWVSENYPEDDPRYFRTSWISGCISAMFEKLREEEIAREVGEKTDEETSNNSNALVLFNSSLAKAYIEFSLDFRRVNVSRVSKGYSHAGYVRGKAFGSSVRIGSKEIEE